MVTQTHKWLPSEPTAEMYTAYYSFRQASLDVDSYKAMWQAAQEIEQEPLSVAELDELWKASYKEHDGGEKAFQNRKRRLKRFARAIEKAHKIGV